MRWIRPISLTLLAIAVLIAILLTIIVNLDPNRFRNEIEHYVSSITGRDFRISGALAIDLGRHTRVTVEGLQLSNPEWAASPVMMRVQNLTLVVDVWSLLDGPLVIERLDLDAAELNLETGQSGINNWTFGESRPKKAGNRGNPIPLVLRQIKSHDFRLIILHPGLQAPLRIQADSHEQTELASGLFEARTAGSINDRPVLINGHYGPLESLVTGNDFEFDLAGKFDTLEIESAGHIDHLFKPVYPELTLTVRGPEIDDVTQMLGLPDLGAGSLGLSASVDPTGDQLQARIHGNLGEYLIDLDAFASAMTDLREAELKLQASGPNLGRAVNLFGLSGLPDDRFDLQGDISRSGKNLTIEKLEFNIGGGHFEFSGTMNQFPNIRESTLKVELNGPDIGRFRQIFNLPGSAAGPFKLDAELQVSTAGTELLNIRARTNMADTTIFGTVTDPPQFVGSLLNVNISGDNLQEVGRAYQIPALVAAPFELAGKIEIRQGHIAIRDTVQLRVGNNLGELEGKIGFSPIEKDTDVRFEVSGPDLREIGDMARIGQGVPQQPYVANGHLRVDTDGFRIHDLEIRIGKADIVAEGFVSRNSRFAGSSVTLSASGPDLEQLLTDNKRFDTPPGPFDASGKITVGVDDIDVENIEISVAGAEISANADIVFPLGWSDFGSTSGKFDLIAAGPDLSAVFPKLEFYQPESTAFRVQATGKWNEAQWRFDKVMLDFEGSQIDFRGELDKPPDWSATELWLRANIGSLAKLGIISKRRLPDLPLVLDTHFTGTPNSFEMDELEASLGTSDISGTFRLSLEKQIPDVQARLRSQLLDVDALLAGPDETSTGVQTEPMQAPDDGRIIPDWQLPLESLRKVNASIDIKVSRAQFRQQPWRDLAIHADIRDGALHVGRSTAQHDNGGIAANYSLTPVDDSAIFTGSLQGSNIGLRLFAQTAEEIDVAPRVDIDMDWTGVGRSLREIAASLDARARIVSNGGRIPNTTSRAGSILYGDFFAELFTTINPFAKEEPFTEVVCYAVILDAVNGIVTANPGIVIQTDKMNIASLGTINLTTEAIDFNFRTASRGWIGLSAGQFINPYIKIAGTMGNPKLMLDPKGTLVSGGAAVLTMGLSILATTAWDRMFRSKDPCGEALAQADEQKKS